MTHDERVAGLLEANNRLVEMARKFKARLRIDHSEFSRYAGEHNRKADKFRLEGDLDNASASRAKAVVNEGHANEIAVLLAQH
jgi:hypothetical protein